MPSISFLLIEAVAFGFALAVGVEAYKAGVAKLMTLLVGMAFGFAIELFFVLVYSGYSYGDFLIDITVGGHSIPLWVAAGWGTIIYISMAATDRMGLPWHVAPAVDGLLAVSLDLTLDPVAEALGWWHWARPGQFFGVPYDNFIGWVLIVAGYSLAVRAGFQVLQKYGLWKDLLVPLLATLPAVAAVAGAQVVLEKFLYPAFGEPHTFALLVGVLVLGSFGALWKTTTYQKTPWYLWAVPVSYHGLMMLLLFAAGISTTTPELILFMFTVPFASLFLFTFPQGLPYADAQTNQT